MKELSRLMLTVLFCTPCVPIDHVMFWGTDRKKEVKAVILVGKNARLSSRLRSSIHQEVKSIT